MKKLMLIVLLAILMLVVAPAGAQSNTLFVDDDGVCNGKAPCYVHPQEAVNAANPGDRIRVYPGTYSNPADLEPAYDVCQDDNAPTIIIYKDGLTLEAVKGSDETFIEATQPCWSNPGAVETWTDGAIRSIASPNAVAIVADNVTVKGFTIASTYAGDPDAPSAFPNTGGIFIGGMFAGDLTTARGVGGATIERNVVSGWSAIRIFSSPNNEIRRNQLSNIDPLTSNTPRGSVVHGFDEGTVASGGLVVEKNEIDATHATNGVVLSGDMLAARPVRIEKNQISNASVTGIHLYNSDLSDSVIAHNEITAAEHGIRLSGGLATNADVHHNQIEAGNWGVNAYGITLTSSKIHHNDMPDVRLGVLLGSTPAGDPVDPVSDNEINHNRIHASHPEVTVVLLENTVNNEVEHDQLEADTQQGNETVQDLGTDNSVAHNR